MKARTLIPVLLFLIIAAMLLQAHSQQCADAGFVSIGLRNNSWHFRKFTIITYRPGERENSAFAFRLGPGMRRTFWLPVGTRVYNASVKQDDLVMSGQPLTGKPLLTVSPSDKGRIIPLVD